MTILLRNEDGSEFEFPDGVSAGYVDEDGVVHQVDVGDGTPPPWVERLRAKFTGTFVNAN